MFFSKTIFGFCCVALLTLSNNAFSEEAVIEQAPVPAKTGLRCLYKSNDSNVNTDFSWEWGDSKDYWLDGYWRYRAAVISNMFYTDKTQKELLNLCQKAFQDKGINKPVAMMAAADNSASTNYMIWNNDPAVQENKINKIVAFGDSLSDTQNVFNASTWGFPLRKNFYMGRFSNGENWLDYFSEMLSLPVYDWAVGGAGVEDAYGLIPALGSQVASWINYMDKDYAKNYRPDLTLFTITIGVNDLKSYDKTAKEILDEVTIALTELIDSGAKNILILNLPDMTRAPAFKTFSADKIKHIEYQVSLYNRDLIVTVNDFKRSHPDVHIWVFDIHHLFNDFLNHAANYGISNITQSCLSIGENDNDFYLIARPRRPECELAKHQADSFLFWDTLHPTSHAHQILADKVYCFVEDAFKSDAVLVQGSTNSRRPDCHGSSSMMGRF